MQIRLEWPEFIDAALRGLPANIRPKGFPVLMRKNEYEPDSECFDQPSYVMIDVESTENVPNPF